MKIALIGAQKKESNCTHWSGIRKGMEELGIDYYELDVIYFRKEQIISEIKKFKPDLVIHGLTDFFYSHNGKYSKILRNNYDGKIAWWYADYRDEETGNYLKKDLSKEIDYVFVSNDSQKDFWKEKVGVSAHFIAQAGTPVDKIEYNKNFKNNIVFVGTLYNEGFLKPRTDIIKEITQQTKIVQINGENCAERMIVCKNLPKIYGSAKICLDISNIWTAEKYTSNRYYVIAACGGFSLCKRFPGCEKLFPEGAGKIYFETVNDFIKLKNYYINKPKKRKEIALTGLDHSRKYHTYKHRIKDIIKICNLK